MGCATSHSQGGAGSAYQPAKSAHDGGAASLPVLLKPALKEGGGGSSPSSALKPKQETAEMKPPRKVVIVEPEEGEEMVGTTSGFQRSGKRKATPFHGQAVELDIGADADSEEGGDGRKTGKVSFAETVEEASPGDFQRTSKRKATPFCKVKPEIVEETPTKNLVTNTSFSRTSKRKATPFLAKGAMPAVGVDDDSDAIDDASPKEAVDARKVTVIAPDESEVREGKHPADGHFSRSSKRKATPFLKDAVVAPDTESEEEEVATETQQPQNRVTFVDDGQVPTAAFSRTAKRKATPFVKKGDMTVDSDDDEDTNAKTVKKVTVVEPTEEAGDEDLEMQSTHSGFQRTSKRKATPFVKKGTAIVVLADDNDADDGTEEEADDDDEDVGDAQTMEIKRIQKRKATPWVRCSDGPAPKELLEVEQSHLEQQNSQSSWFPFNCLCVSTGVAKQEVAEVSTSEMK